MKKLLIGAIIVFAILVGVQQHETSFGIPVSAADSNCQYQNGSNNTVDRSVHLNGYNVCLTADYMWRLVQKRPYPQTQITDSLERRNLTEKLLRFNDPNKIGYLTEITNAGTILATYTVKGKVSSNQSALTAPEQCDSTGNGVGNCFTSPGDDGSYGLNEDGIFFFDTGGVMHQYNGIYNYTDAPQQLTTPPLITFNANDKPSSAFDIGK